MYGIGAHATFTIEGVRVGMNTCSQHSEATLNIEEAEKTHDVKSGKLEEWKISLRSLSIADRTLSVSGVPRVRSNGSIPPPIPPTLPFEPALGSVEILWLQSDLIDSLVSSPMFQPLYNNTANWNRNIPVPFRILVVDIVKNPADDILDV
eukprot:CAMPEP_0118633764 /NCGR_PEP_ID=MMETSP0785-20121206/1175_1 /TAXON_ID=91992 /ORGANISM="Bolidomonas pacifica, Strain CCMP 1866" /LENGTH=149 /DNA_ID=CAMNT_0006524669 /DNA_START=303 /DNA_END=751 /DNA_ORIENTATION=-